LTAANIEKSFSPIKCNKLAKKAACSFIAPAGIDGGEFHSPISIHSPAAAAAAGAVSALLLCLLLSAHRFLCVSDSLNMQRKARKLWNVFFICRGSAALFFAKCGLKCAHVGGETLNWNSLAN